MLVESLRRMCANRHVLFVVAGLTFASPTVSEGMTQATAQILKTAMTEADVARDIGYVPMKDGTRISYISYRSKSGNAPTVFFYSPYTGDATAFDIAKPFLEAGYAFVGANWPATGCSEGVVEHWLDGFDRKIGVFGAEVVEWIAKQPWSDGNVGMVGNSSPGTVQFWVAAEQPPHLKAIVASGVEDGYEDWLQLGGMTRMHWMAPWAVETKFALSADWRISQGDKECAAILDGGTRAVRKSFVDEARNRPLKDEWWHAASLATEKVAGKVNVPTLLIAARQDEYGGAGRESVRLFRQLMPNVKQKKLLLLNGDHDIAGPGPRGYGLVDDERMAFLDRWVKHVDNGIEDELPVTVFWDVHEPNGDPKKAVPGWSTHHKTWPEPTVERHAYYLTKDAKISPDKPGGDATESARAYIYPTGTELYGNNQQFALEPYSEGVLNYRTAPVVSDMTLLGNPEVTLYLSIDHGDDADLVITLKDVDPKGSVLFLQSGLLRSSLRAIDQQRSYSDEIIHSFRKSEKLKPGQIYEVRMSLLSPIAHVVRKGHSLELTIGAPNPIPHPVIGSIPVGESSVNRVYHSEKYPSKILLPVIPGATAQAPPLKCGAQRNQPCRKVAAFDPGGLPIQ